ncbi:MAG: beta-ketoacyl synthase N-terminal-like domain-containing protein [Planctomycetia bacterium]|nr:beta-ketoacyl synthase N-terminal-like domain-containing protein [Planctomycetia bacterium]
MKTGLLNRRVVITGMGIVSSAGLSLDRLWDVCCSGKSSVRRLDIPHFDSSVAPYCSPASEFSGKIEDFGDLDGNLKKNIRKGLKLMSREIQMGVASAQFALNHACLKSGIYPSERIGVSFASDYIITTPDEVLDGMRACRNGNAFDFSRWAQNGLVKMTPIWQLKFLPNMPASHIAIYNEFFGPGFAITNREASIGTALEESVEIIRSGRADIMVVGATGSRLHPFKLIHAIQQGTLSTEQGNPENICRPFDLYRNGTVPGEGAGALILENAESALKRKAVIYAEIIGGSSRCVIHKNKNAKDSNSVFASAVDDIEKSLTLTLSSLLQKYQRSPESIGHINAFGLGARQYDSAEAKAIRNVFGNVANSIPVTTLKGHLGNPGAGGGAIELIAGILALKNNALFPILNNRNDDLECPIHPVRTFGEPTGDSFIKLCYQKFGQSSAVLLQRWNEQ